MLCSEAAALPFSSASHGMPLPSRGGEQPKFKRNLTHFGRARPNSRRVWPKSGFRAKFVEVGPKSVEPAQDLRSRFGANFGRTLSKYGRSRATTRPISGQVGQNGTRLGPISTDVDGILAGFDGLDKFGPGLLTKVAQAMLLPNTKAEHCLLGNAPLHAPQRTGPWKHCCPIWCTYLAHACSRQTSKGGAMPKGCLRHTSLRQTGAKKGIAEKISDACGGAAFAGSPLERQPRIVAIADFVQQVLSGTSPAVDSNNMVPDSDVSAYALRCTCGADAGNRQDLELAVKPWGASLGPPPLATPKVDRGSLRSGPKPGASVVRNYVFLFSENGGVSSTPAAPARSPKLPGSEGKRQGENVAPRCTIARRSGGKTCRRNSGRTHIHMHSELRHARGFPHSWGLSDMAPISTLRRTALGPCIFLPRQRRQACR